MTMCEAETVLFDGFHNATLLSLRGGNETIVIPTVAKRSGGILDVSRGNFRLQDAIVGVWELVTSEKTEIPPARSG